VGTGDTHTGTQPVATGDTQITDLKRYIYVYMYIGRGKPSECEARVVVEERCSGGL